jgi:hypothetical protein
LWTDQISGKFFGRFEPFFLRMFYGRSEKSGQNRLTFENHILKTNFTKPIVGKPIN